MVVSIILLKVWLLIVLDRGVIVDEDIFGVFVFVNFFWYFFDEIGFVIFYKGFWFCDGCFESFWNSWLFVVLVGE